jgi:Beta protein
MTPNTNFYVPSVRWRTGEYQALLKLSDAAKNQIVPLITIPPLEYDFEDGEAKKTVQEHVGSFPKRYKDKWKTRKAWIDIDPSVQSAKMDNGLTVFEHVFAELRKFGAEAVPVASLDCKADVIAMLVSIVGKDKKGVAVRARLEHVMLQDFGKRLVGLMAALKAGFTQADLIVDLGTPAYEPYDVFASALAAALSKIPHLHQFRSFALIGTAFPDSLTVC